MAFQIEREYNRDADAFFKILLNNMVTGKREKVKEWDRKNIKKSFGIIRIPNDCESGGHEIRTRNPRKGRLISNEVASH